MKSPPHSKGSFARVLCERKCRALARTEATRPKQWGNWHAITNSSGVRTTAEHSQLAFVCGKCRVGQTCQLCRAAHAARTALFGKCACHDRVLDLLDAASITGERVVRV